MIGWAQIKLAIGTDLSVLAINKKSVERFFYLQISKAVSESDIPD